MKQLTPQAIHAPRLAARAFAKDLREQLATPPRSDRLSIAAVVARRGHTFLRRLGHSIHTCSCNPTLVGHRCAVAYLRPPTNGVARVHGEDPEHRDCNAMPREPHNYLGIQTDVLEVPKCALVIRGPFGSRRRIDYAKLCHAVVFSLAPTARRCNKSHGGKCE